MCIKRLLLKNNLFIIYAINFFLCHINVGDHIMFNYLKISINFIIMHHYIPIKYIYANSTTIIYKRKIVKNLKFYL